MPLRVEQCDGRDHCHGEEREVELILRGLRGERDEQGWERDACDEVDRVAVEGLGDERCTASGAAEPNPGEGVGRLVSGPRMSAPTTPGVIPH